MVSVVITQTAAHIRYINFKTFTWDCVVTWICILGRRPYITE